MMTVFKRLMQSRLLPWLSIALLVLVLIATFRGRPGVGNNALSYQHAGDQQTHVTGPFESSNTNSRYALVDSIVNNRSFNFTTEQAAFAVPDAVYVDGKFASIFMPGVSFVAAPFYYLGQRVGLAQVFTFISTILLALLNVVLLYKLGRAIHLGNSASILGSLVFLLGSNALAYAHTLTQHHASTALILSALVLIMKKEGFIRNILFGLVFGASLLFDIPNIFLLLPPALLLTSKHIGLKEVAQKTQLMFNSSVFGIALGMLPFIAVFLLYNQATFGSPFIYGQMFPRTDYFDTLEQQEQRRKRHENVDLFEDVLPLGTRQQLLSTYILLISDERSWAYYSPIILIGILGLILALRNKNDEKTTDFLVVCLGIILMNIVVYSMFGDPWGGWSFGPRYLIPAAAILSLFVGVAFEKYKTKPLFMLVFLALTLYSTSISALGSLSTLSIPPKVEAVQLTTQIPYTYEYNLNLLEENKGSSLIFNAWAHNYISSWQYWIVVSSISGVAFSLLIVSSIFEKKKS